MSESALEKLKREARERNLRRKLKQLGENKWRGRKWNTFI
jgi:hypothetical protein